MSDHGAIRPGDDFVDGQHAPDRFGDGVGGQRRAGDRSDGAVHAYLLVQAPAGELVEEGRWRPVLRRFEKGDHLHPLDAALGIERDQERFLLRPDRMGVDVRSADYDSVLARDVACDERGRQRGAGPRGRGLDLRVGQKEAVARDLRPWMRERQRFVARQRLAGDGRRPRCHGDHGRHDAPRHPPVSARQNAYPSAMLTWSRPVRALFDVN